MRIGGRALHAKAVRRFRMAAEGGDAAVLRAMLDAEVSVVIDAGHPDEPLHVVRGPYEAVALLLHGLRRVPGQTVEERPVSGQAGLLLQRGGRIAAAIAVDFTGHRLSGHRISAVWVRLEPAQLRHGHHV